MKKIILYILIVLLSLSVLTACGREAHTVPSEEAIPEKPVIVTTIFPVYDWIIQILGEQAENLEVDMLLDSGVDLHSYHEIQKAVPQATPRMLSKQFKELEEDGVINRVLYPVVPPRTEYSLTEMGQTLVPIVESLCKWGEHYFALADVPVPCE